jgi:DNA-binding response OmpR family regulator
MENWNVLLVDDEQEFASTLGERLSLRGIRVRVATSGQEALQRVAEEAPEVVILDLMMPGMNGLAVLNQIKAHDPKIQVILLTGMASTEEGIKGLDLGACDYLVKPVQIEGLIEKIRQAVHKLCQKDQ